MPNCFTLTPIGETAPAKFTDIDEAMCRAFLTSIDPDRWYQNWYNIEGLGLAMGMSWDKMRELNPDRAPIIEWLEKHYTTDAWYEHK